MEGFEFLKWLGHASFFIEANEKKVYIDPFRVKSPLGEADIVLLTHPHFDHTSEEDLKKVVGKDTILVAPEKVEGAKPKEFVKAEPGKVYKKRGISFSALPAYNTNPSRMKFHPKEKGWVGYIVEANGKKIYHAGDTDFIEEMRDIDADLALLPIGGTYTMD
ncbi:MAG: MBL fold metallo-hydrolase, partial [Candidatus Micrarchaeaceae archaeon]